MSELSDARNTNLEEQSRRLNKRIALLTRRYAASGHVTAAAPPAPDDHVRRRAALEAAMQHGKLWEIVRAEFALDLECLADGLLKPISSLERNTSKKGV